MNDRVLTLAAGAHIVGHAGVGVPHLLDGVVRGVDPVGIGGLVGSHVDNVAAETTIQSVGGQEQH